MGSQRCKGKLDWNQINIYLAFSYKIKKVSYLRRKRGTPRRMFIYEGGKKGEERT